MGKLQYENLVPSRNSGKPKFMAFLRMILDPIVGAMAAADSMDTAFLIDNAAGAQLDTIGELVGISRILPIIPSVGTRELDDEEYRLLILLKIARNSWDGTTGSALDVYKNVFGDKYTIEMVDGQNMSVNFQFYGNITTREAEILAVTNTLLIPAGVRRSIEIVGSEVTVYLYRSTAISGECASDTVRMTGLYVSDVENIDSSILENMSVYVIDG